MLIKIQILKKGPDPTGSGSATLLDVTTILETYRI
jgi:hypothetical protein